MPDDVNTNAAPEVPAGPQPEGQVLTDATGEATDPTAQAPQGDSQPYDYEKGYKSLQPDYTRKSQRLKEVEAEATRIRAENEAMKQVLSRLAGGQPAQEPADPIAANLAELDRQLEEDGVPDYTRRIILNQQKALLENSTMLANVTGMTARQTATQYAQEMAAEFKGMGLDLNTDLGKETLGVLKSQWGLDPADASTFIKDAQTMSPEQARDAIKRVSYMAHVFARASLEQRAPKKEPGPPLESPGGGAPEEPAGPQKSFGSFRELANAHRKALPG